MAHVERGGGRRRCSLQRHYEYASLAIIRGFVTVESKPLKLHTTVQLVDRHLFAALRQHAERAVGERSKIGWTVAAVEARRVAGTGCFLVEKGAGLRGNRAIGGED